MLEIRGAAPGLLDDPFLLDVSGAPPATELLWRARIRDDDGFVWRAEGPRPDALAWAPAKASAGPVAALASLRPVAVDVRVEAPDGATSSRTLTRTLLGKGVKVRRWRQDVTGSLYLPATPAAAALIVLPPPPGTSRDDSTPTIDLQSSLDAAGSGLPAVVAALLASRGVLVFVVTGGKGDARELVASLPTAPARIDTLAALPLPPGLPARAPGDAAAWDALLADLGATPRRVAR
jgi:hypothetical protein